MDDDSFLHVANLVTDLRRLHCVPHLHYGNMAYSGYDPSIWRKCVGCDLTWLGLLGLDVT